MEDYCRGLSLKESTCADDHVSGLETAHFGMFLVSSCAENTTLYDFNYICLRAKRVVALSTANALQAQV